MVLETIFSKLKYMWVKYVTHSLFPWNDRYLIDIGFIFVNIKIVKILNQNVEVSIHKFYTVSHVSETMSFSSICVDFSFYYIFTDWCYELITKYNCTR